MYSSGHGYIHDGREINLGITLEGMAVSKKHEKHLT